MARNAPWRSPLADPAIVGERIVQALLSGRRELQWGAGERMLTIAYRAMPWLVAELMARHHALFVRIMSSENDD